VHGWAGFIEFWEGSKVGQGWAGFIEGLGLGKVKRVQCRFGSVQRVRLGLLKVWEG
jgi:hypothetical protein